MLRCVTAAALANILALAMAATALPAAAQAHRNFPATALRGEATFSAPPEIVLNGQPARLAPGARIRGQNNLLQAPASLAGQRLLVHYTVELNTGLLLDVWVLNDAERANRLWPTNPREAQTWTFDPVGQTWKRP